MSAYLCLSTSTPLASLALKTERGVKKVKFNKKDNPHCEAIMNQLRLTLEQEELTAKDLIGIVVDHGPGSFTGIRIGIATAMGLAISLKTGVYGVSSLELLACQMLQKEKFEGPFLVGMNGGRKEIYGALFEGKEGVLEKKSEEKIFSIEDFKALQRQYSFGGYELSSLGFESQNLFPEGGDIFWENKYSEESFWNDKVGQMVTPNYIRLSDAELNLKKK